MVNQLVASSNTEQFWKRSGNIESIDKILGDLKNLHDPSKRIVEDANVSEEGKSGRESTSSTGKSGKSGKLESIY